MATIDLITNTNDNHPRTTNTHQPYYVEVTLDIEDAIAEKGSAVAAADVIEVIQLPSECVVWAAGMEVMEVFAGTSTGLALDLGVTGIDADVFVDGFDFDGASVGDYTQQPAAYQPVVIGGTADTLDLLIQAQDGTFTAGVLRIWALLCDVDGKGKPGVTALKS